MLIVFFNHFVAVDLPDYTILFHLRSKGEQYSQSHNEKHLSIFSALRSCPSLVIFQLFSAIRRSISSALMPATAKP